ncbi:replication protein A 70 kDa DNA-binding subunit B-like [Telopea speciosissima]|uniref:replication protein A 70 kDa DNA-binding subunit B-like n=1 Tax=Telopea speciosissima TaxID=54955 RepID=UPI001CC81938|nr:replication protein A 70 kDa DNA-binding subunit B-like [Telopea speciosissima]
MADVEKINDLKPFQRDWKVRVVVVQQCNLVNYNNDKGTGKIQKIIIMDDEGTKIQAVMFNKIVDKFDNTLIEGRTYIITDGLVKRVNPNLKNVHKVVELTFTNFTKIEEDDKISDVDNNEYNFIDLKEISNQMDKENNVFESENHKTSTNNVIRLNRELQIINNDSDQIMLTLWGEFAKNEGQKLMDMLSEKPIVAFSSLTMVKFQALRSGIQDVELKKSLIIDEIGDMYELFSHCEKYINLAEVLGAEQEKEGKSEKKVQEKKDA